MRTERVPRQVGSPTNANRETSLPSGTARRNSPECNGEENSV
jgi:hypothetical protein